MWFKSVGCSAGTDLKKKDLDYLRNFDMRIFFGAALILFLLAVISRGRNAGGDALWSLLVLAILSFPIGTLLIGVFLGISLAAEMNYSHIGAVVMSFTLAVGIIVIAYLQWFVWVEKRERFLVTRYYLLRFAFLMSLVPFLLRLRLLVNSG